MKGVVDVKQPCASVSNFLTSTNTNNTIEPQIEEDRSFQQETKRESDGYHNSLSKGLALSKSSDKLQQARLDNKYKRVKQEKDSTKNAAFQYMMNTIDQNRRQFATLN